MGVGIVVVSHSRALAEAAVDLASQMLTKHTAQIAVAAGLADGSLGTDATSVASAIAEVDQGEGVVLFVDMGSAVLSAELGLELYGEHPSLRVLSAPFVEGLVAGAVRAATGGSLEEVVAEAEGAMAPKRSALGVAEPVTAAAPVEGVTREVVIADPQGLHARPAALLVELIGRFDAKVQVSCAERGPVSASSPIALATLAAKQGSTLRFQATGAQAVEVLDAVAAQLAGEG